MIIRKSYNFFQRLLSLKAYGLRYSRDIHLEPKMPFCDIVSQVGCPNGSLSFPLGFSICPTDIQIGWVGVQMNVTRTIFPYLGHPERAGEQPPGFPKSPHLKVQSEKSALQRAIGLLRYSGRDRSNLSDTFRAGSLGIVVAEVVLFGQARPDESVMKPVFLRTNR